MKRRDLVADLRGQTVAELTGSLTQSRKRLIELAFTTAFRKQKNVHEARELRKQIARLETILRQTITIQTTADSVKKETR